MSPGYINYSKEFIDSKIIVKDELLNKAKTFIWKIRFSAPLDPSTINNMNIYVTTTENEPLKTSIRYNSKDFVIEVIPGVEYSSKKNYILTITKKVRSENGKPLKKEIKLPFSIVQ